MSDDKEFQTKIQRIGELVAELDNVANPELRASTKALIQLILDLNAAGLERALDVVAGGDQGQRTIDQLGDDPLVSSLLVLYGLHPLDLETRVERAVEKVAPKVRKGGGEAELLGISSGVVRVRLQVTGHSCGSTGKTIQGMVEEALYEAAPDMAGLQIEGLEDHGASNGTSGFVPLGKLGGVMGADVVISAPNLN